MNFAKKYSLMMLLLTGAMTIVSCSNDTEEFQKSENTAINFYAGMPNVEADTRTTLDDFDQPMWSESDELDLFSNITNDNAYDLTTDNNVLPDYTANFKMEGRSQVRFGNNRDKMDWTVAYHGSQAAEMMKTGLLIRNGNGSTQRLKRQTIPYDGINGAEDLLISRKVDAKKITTGSTNELRFKRLSSIMKIKFVNETGDPYFNDYKVSKGWITTGDRIPNFGELPESGIYKDNNFAGSAYVNLEEGSANEYNLIKAPGKGSGIEFTTAPGEDYFYDFADPDNWIYISVYPTKLAKGEKFTIGFGDGTKTKYINKTLTAGDEGFEVKGCHIHEITITLKPGDVIEYN